jgi:hypothetical protein
MKLALLSPFSINIEVVLSEWHFSLFLSKAAFFEEIYAILCILNRLFCFPLSPTWLNILQGGGYN